MKTKRSRIVNREQKSVGITLPTKPHKPETNHHAYAYLIYGEKKIGKSSLSAEEKNSLIIQFDKPQIALPVMEIFVKNWRTMLATLKALEAKATEDAFPYPMLVIDGTDVMYALCMDHVCKEEGVEHPTDMPYGKGWAATRREFSNVVRRLLALPCGHIFIAHGTEIEIETHIGETKRRFVPRLAAQAEEIINGQVDAWFFYAYCGKRRVLITQGDEKIGAGHRIQGHFLTTEGKPVKAISMGTSAAMAYKRLLDGFYNRLEEEAPEWYSPQYIRKDIATKKKIERKR